MPATAGWIGDAAAYDRIFWEAEVSDRSPLEYLQFLLRTPSPVMTRTRPGYVGWMPNLPSLGDRVLRAIFKHLRKQICTKRKIGMKGATATALCASVAALVAPELPFPKTVVVGIVAAVMQCVLTLMRDVFCELTDDKAIETIGSASRPSEPSLPKTPRKPTGKKKAASKKKQ